MRSNVHLLLWTLMLLLVLGLTILAFGPWP
jgi:hypothetical protein